MTAHVAQALRPFAIDVAGAVELSWGVWDQGDEVWLFRNGDDQPARIESGFEGDGWLLNIGRNWTLIDLPTTDEMLTEIAGLVQDAVMDEIGKGWPEHHTRDGAFMGLLAPRSFHERITWRLNDAPFCLAGQLAQTLGRPLG